MLFSQSLKIVVGKLSPAESVPSLQLLQASIEFVSPFVAEVSVPCAIADALLAEGGDVGWWEAALTAHAAWSASVACHLVEGLEAVPPVVAGLRRNCVAFILHALAVATYAPEAVCASQSLRLLTLLHRCGFTVDDAVARLTVLAMRARRGVPIDSDAEVDDSDEDEAPLASRTELSWPGPGAAVAAAVAILFASPLLSSVYLPLAWLQTCVMCVPWLMQLPSPAPSLPGSPQVLAVRLLRSACAAVIAGSNYINDVSSPEFSPEVQLTRCVVSFMVSCPDKASRTSCLHAFEAYAATFHVRARYVAAGLVPLCARTTCSNVSL